MSSVPASASTAASWSADDESGACTAAATSGYERSKEATMSS